MTTRQWVVLAALAGLVVYLWSKYERDQEPHPVTLLVIPGLVGAMAGVVLKTA
jgi:RsiW-degrading membrane proteinase PrsW (M82 family)